MIRTSVLHQTHFLLPPEDLPKIPDCNFRFKEQECLSLLKKCNSMDEFKQAHVQFIKWGFCWNSFCGSNLVSTCALSDWGSMDYASSIFEQMDEVGAFTFNTMIRGHERNMGFEDALLLYDEMLGRGVEPDNFTYPALLKACVWLQAFEEGMQFHGHVFKLGLEGDVFVQNSLINFYGKCGNVKLSSAVFEKMEEKSIASWSAIIAAYSRLGMWLNCLMLFREMISEGCWRAEDSILVSVLSACTHLGALDLGRYTHAALLRNMSSLNVIVETSLIDMYVKCGCIEKGLSLFQKMAKKNQLSYSVMISGLAMHGRGKEALRVFSEMLEDGLEPDDVVYLGLLSACSHAGLIDEGLHYFDRMNSDHGIEPTVQHYGCMVDLMGRAGKLKEALELVQSMPIEPNDVVWRSLLSACKIHQELEIGEIAARNLFRLNTNHPSDHLVLSSMYARAHRWEDAARTRTEIAGNGLTKIPGFSLVEVKRKVYKFVSQDMFHPQCNGVYEMIHQMEWQLKFEGYNPDTTQVLHNVDEAEKRQVLKGHCQKLAIAFALIHTSHGSPIRIARNLRMCSDCHTYTKLISTIYAREITVRDRYRFHHFKDGTCSCKDYW